MLSVGEFEAFLAAVAGSCGRGFGNSHDWFGAPYSSITSEVYTAHEAALADGTDAYFQCFATLRCNEGAFRSIQPNLCICKAA